MTESEAMVDEFDTMAQWTARAVEELGDDYALPAACRGSGSPEALEWLGRTMGLSRGTTLLDVGAGVGGPAEKAAQDHGLRPVLAEPMLGACIAARRLFSRPTVVADGAALPFPDDSFQAVWSLGVLCTLEDKTSMLAEMVRVAAPDGVVGLLVYLRTVDALPDQPDGNHFPTAQELDQLLDRVGLRVVASAELTDFAAPSAEWTAAEARVDDVIKREHSTDERWQRAQEQQETMGRLIGADQVRGRLLVCDRTPAR
jgi:ubiquinone/menaquinone biosynthesis C-methylase UbiE